MNKSKFIAKVYSKAYDSEVAWVWCKINNWVSPSFGIPKPLSYSYAVKKCREAMKEIKCTRYEIVEEGTYWQGGVCF